MLVAAGEARGMTSGGERRLKLWQVRV